MIFWFSIFRIQTVGIKLKCIYSNIISNGVSEYREIPYPSETDSFMWKAYKLPVIFRWDRFLIQTGHNSLLAGFFRLCIVLVTGRNTIAWITLFSVCAACIGIISPILLFFAENFSHVNLIIEQGNTSSKLQYTIRSTWEASFVYKKFDVDELESLFGKYDFKHGILSTVIGKNEVLNDYLRGRLRRFIFWMKL